tara:strand:- start:214 stop:447 length:234 start_codon:yes stop_codon:yes gene_type:complete
MSNKNWNDQTANSSGSTGGVKSNWSDRSTNSVPNAKPKEKEKTCYIPEGTINDTAKGMGAATKGGKYSWVGPKDSKW